jgi:conjugative relaxase-like TrwC/TraI family protein
MGWMRMMGGQSVDYHRRTVVEHGDDFPGQALAYYASRGETPLIWGGSGAGSLGLAGAVTGEEYEQLYGPGGARHPVSGERLVSTRRPGMEIVISAHKSVAELGVIGRGEHMHLIMDAERDATLAYLDAVTRRMGGRRGEAAVATPTAGLIYAHTRHATSRAGDPCPHDHVLLANLVEMADGRGGWKAADTTLWREQLHAATMAGRVASARAAVELGYAIEADPGPSGKLGHWLIAGVADEVIAVHSKRAAEIEAECARRGESSYQARGVAARTTRSAKDGHVEADLIERWRGELAGIGWPVDRLAAAIDAASAQHGPRPRLTLPAARQIMAEVVAADGDLARRKVFSRRHVIVAMAPRLYGQDPALLEALVDRLLADPEIVPLVGVAGAREQAHSLASVIARETAIADSLSRGLGRSDGPATTASAVTAAVGEVEAGLGGRLSGEQASAAMAICISGRGAELVVGVAGAGKTTMLKAVAAAFETAGHRVVGTATSGQAACNLGREAELGESATLASLIWRLEHGQVRLDDKTVVLCDEVGMTDDVDLVRVCAHAEVAGAKLVLIGDHRQLGAVGPGGALAALVARHPDAVHYLMDNRRQHDPGERRSLDQLRDGDINLAVSWYQTQDRIHAIPVRDDALRAAVDAWAADVAAGHDAALFAWRRANVAALNQAAREWMQATGRLSGPELVCPGGLAYRAGDRVVALAPGPDRSLVTSQLGTVVSVDPQQDTLILRTDDGRDVTLTSDQAGAERLGYSYATTVHRLQGSTVARGHLYVDGGGRELAYVAMSRARESTHIWTVADDDAQAVEDLNRDWSERRAPTWAIDTGQPASRQPGVEQPDGPTPQHQIRLAALLSAESAIAAKALGELRRPDRREAIEQARGQLERLRRQRAYLDKGRGVYHDSDAGTAVRDLSEAERAGKHARWEAETAPGWRQRRAAAKQASVWSARETDAIGRRETHHLPEAARLDGGIRHWETTIADLVARADKEQAGYRAVARLTSEHTNTKNKLARTMAAYRDHLDSIQPAAPRSSTRPVQPSSAAGIPPPHPTPQPPRPGVSM